MDSQKVKDEMINDEDHQVRLRQPTNVNEFIFIEGFYQIRPQCAVHYVNC